MHICVYGAVRHLDYQDLIVSLLWRQGRTQLGGLEGSQCLGGVLAGNNYPGG